MMTTSVSLLAKSVLREFARLVRSQLEAVSLPSAQGATGNTAARPACMRAASPGRLPHPADGERSEVPHGDVHVLQLMRNSLCTQASLSLQHWPRLRRVPYRVLQPA